MITLLCGLLIFIISISAVWVIKQLKAPTLPQDNLSDSQDTTDLTDNQQNNTMIDKPNDNPADIPNDEPSVKPNDEPSVQPNDEPSVQPNDEPSVQPNDEPSVQPNEPIIKEQMPTSYKDFSLTKGKNAKEAYDILNSFLESKYSILTNKQNKVSSDYEPSNLAVPNGCDYKMEKTAGDALVKMLSAAKSDGYYDLVLYSGYRTYASQKNKYETRTQKYLNQGYSQAEAEAKAGEYIAPPGSSEHHTGLAADVCSWKIVSKYGYLSDDFDTTAEFRWLEQNCAKYGFILRYKKGCEDITGFLYEPWHFRYIGVEHATACTALDITYEEYYQLLLKMRDEAKTDAGA